jgi:hypothetical protein
MMQDRQEPRTWVSDGEQEWVGRLTRLRDDGRAIVETPEHGRVLAAWTPWEPPPRVVAVLCVGCERPTAPDEIVRGGDGAWLCPACEQGVPDGPQGATLFDVDGGAARV